MELEEEITKRHKETFKDNGMFIIFTVVVVSLAYTHMTKLTKLYTLKMLNSLLLHQLYLNNADKTRNESIWKSSTATKNNVIKNT